MSSPGSPFFIGTVYQFHCTVAGLGIERLQEAGRVQIVAGADQDVVADHDRRHRGEVLRVEIGDVLVPALLSGLRPDRPGNRRASPCRASCPTCPGRDCRCACRPWSSRSNARARGRRAHRPPRRCRASRVEDAVHLEDRRADVRSPPPPPCASPVPSPPTIVGTPPPPPSAAAAAAAAGRPARGQPRRPGQRQVLDVGLIDLCQRDCSACRSNRRSKSASVRRAASGAPGSRPCAAASAGKKTER